jgi:hypothetical protein
MFQPQLTHNVGDIQDVSLHESATTIVLPEIEVTPSCLALSLRSG